MRDKGVGYDTGSDAGSSGRLKKKKTGNPSKAVPGKEDMTYPFAVVKARASKVVNENAPPMRRGGKVVKYRVSAGAAVELDRKVTKTIKALLRQPEKATMLSRLTGGKTHSGRATGRTYNVSATRRVFGVGPKEAVTVLLASEALTDDLAELAVKYMIHAGRETLFESDVDMAFRHDLASRYDADRY